jgi:superfamily I DNA/RNA helicase
VIGLEHKILPHEKALADRGERGLDEERRLCYVGCTRARKILRVTGARSAGQLSRTKTARFKPTVAEPVFARSGADDGRRVPRRPAEAGFVPTEQKPPSRAKPKPRKAAAKR